MTIGCRLTPIQLDTWAFLIAVQPTQSYWFHSVKLWSKDIDSSCLTCIAQNISLVDLNTVLVQEAMKGMCYTPPQHNSRVVQHMFHLLDSGFCDLLKLRWIVNSSETPIWFTSQTNSIQMVNICAVFGCSTYAKQPTTGQSMLSYVCPPQPTLKWLDLSTQIKVHSTSFLFTII